MITKTKTKTTITLMIIIIPSSITLCAALVMLYRCCGDVSPVVLCAYTALKSPGDVDTAVEHQHPGGTDANAQKHTHTHRDSNI